MKDKFYVLATVIVIGATIGLIVYKNKNDSQKFDPFNDDKEEENINGNNDSGNLGGISGDDIVANFIEGILRISDDLEKGSLKLSSKYGEIYLRTSKDFSSLVGSEVIVSIDGTIEAFKLIDIQKKVEDNGFISQ